MTPVEATPCSVVHETKNSASPEAWRLPGATASTPRGLALLNLGLDFHDHARKNWLAELETLHRAKDNVRATNARKGTLEKKTGKLGHGSQLEDAGKNRLSRKMPLEDALGNGDGLAADRAVPNERPPEEDSSKDRFKDLKLADDPRMVNPKDGE